MPFRVSLLEYSIRFSFGELGVGACVGACVEKRLINAKLAAAELIRLKQYTTTALSRNKQK
jgi:hypothetical protein